jgi:hypothetical protein
MLSALKKFPLSHAVHAMTDIAITHNVAAIWAVSEYLIMEAHRIAKDIVWLMKRKKKTKRILENQLCSQSTLKYFLQIAKMRYRIYTCSLDA